MVPFDVVSLFTNIPLEETIDIVCNYASLTNIPRRKLQELLLLCTKNVQFCFNTTIYKQIDGMAMGSPLGPVLADILLSELECKLDHAIQETKLYVRYVDDTLFICKNELNGSKLPSSSIGKHIVDYSHAVDRTQSFRILAKLRTPQILRFAEACAIRRIKPDLCVQKDFVVHLALPW